MNYNRNEMSELNTFKSFTEGVHTAKISEITPKKSKNGSNMFEVHLAGDQGETGRYYLTFGMDWSDSNLQRILASIEDNNQKIAPIDYGYNKNTVRFLTDKRVFIFAKARTGTYVDRNGETQSEKGTEIKNFLTMDEFNKRNGQYAQTQNTMNGAVNQIANGYNPNQFQQQSVSKTQSSQTSFPGTDPMAGYDAGNISDDDLPF